MALPGIVHDPQTREIAQLALLRGGHSLHGLTFLRAGTNTVYLAGNVVVRIGAADYDREFLDQQVALAAWLHARQFPTAKPLAPAINIHGRPVTLWERLLITRSPDLGSLGTLARRLHNTTDNYNGPLPGWDPLGRLGDRLDDLTPDGRLTLDDITRLHDLKGRLLGEVATLDLPLPRGVIHGDIHMGNVVGNEDGCHLVDFDRISRGPREWDLVEPLAGAILFTKDTREWERFVTNYGFDLRDVPGWESLVQLRALFMFSWLLTLPPTPHINAQVALRLRYFENPTGDFPAWTSI